MQRLVDGYKRFQKHIFPGRTPLFQKLATGQNPQTLLITCSDSRVVPDMITQSDPGELFICRNAGNMVPSYGEVHGGVSATIEYAVLALNVEQIIVCGHSDCGAMRGVLHPEKLADMPTVQSWLRNADSARRTLIENYPPLNEEQHLRALTEENVLAQLDHLRTHPSVAARLSRGSIQVSGWVYEIRTGEIRCYDATQQRFIPLDAKAGLSALPRPRLQPIAS